MAAESQIQAELSATRRFVMFFGVLWGPWSCWTEDVLKVKLQLKELLAEANEMGQMKEVLSQLLSF